MPFAGIAIGLIDIFTSAKSRATTVALLDVLTVLYPSGSALVDAANALIV